MHEHVSDINISSKSPSVISNHRIEENHNFKWDKVEILDIEPSYNKRLISEMVHIKKQKHGINRQNDTESLPDLYSDILFLLSNIFYPFPPIFPFSVLDNVFLFDISFCDIV